MKSRYKIDYYPMSIKNVDGKLEYQHLKEYHFTFMNDNNHKVKYISYDSIPTTFLNTPRFSPRNTAQMEGELIWFDLSGNNVPVYDNHIFT